MPHISTAFGRFLLLEHDYKDFDAQGVAAEVMAGNIVVVHGVLTEQECSEAVRAAVEFSKYPQTGKNSHRVQHNLPLAKTKHSFHSFNFENVLDAPKAILGVFDSLRDLDNDLSGDRGAFRDNGGISFHPQIIHYPRGGGFFDQHIHPLEPQKIGLIASLTKRGEHYQTGGTLFWNDGEEIDAGPAQSIGSVTLFRYDLPHAVSKVDPDLELEFGKATGRWVAVLPYR